MLADLVLALAVAIAAGVDPPTGAGVVTIQVLGRPSLFGLSLLWLAIPLIVGVGWWLAPGALARPVRAAVVGTVVIYLVATAASCLVLLLDGLGASIGLGAVGFAPYGSLLVLIGLLAYLPFVLGGALVWAAVLAWLGRRQFVAGAGASSSRSSGSSVT